MQLPSVSLLCSQLVLKDHLPVLNIPAYNNWVQIAAETNKLLRAEFWRVVFAVLDGIDSIAVGGSDPLNYSSREAGIQTDWGRCEAAGQSWDFASESDPAEIRFFLLTRSWNDGAILCAEYAQDVY